MTIEYSYIPYGLIGSIRYSFVESNEEYAVIDCLIQIDHHMRGKYHLVNLRSCYHNLFYIYKEYKLLLLDYGDDLMNQLENNLALRSITKHLRNDNYRERF